MNEKTLKKAGTFILNNNEAFHRWYKYLEGYSSCLIEEELNKLSDKDIKTIYDPFCGTGTTSLVASTRGYKSYYSETNPFMQTVIEAKINCVKRLVQKGIGTKHLIDFLNKQSFDFKYKTNNNNVFYSKYFDEEVLFKIIKIRELIKDVEEDDTRKILMLALSSIIVQCSKMIRRGDLRVAKNSEKKKEDFDVVTLFIKKLEEIINDIDFYASEIKEFTIKLADDARDIQIENEIDCVITSPPYLNGTNYIRNTKLELFINDFVSCEDGLAEFHSKGIIAGINNVSKRNENYEILPIVQPYYDNLVKVAYDKRIPIMVAGYFSDMKKVIQKLAISMKNNGYFIMDIGDSQFAGVHIPTHEILSSICKECGFEKYSEEILRERRSKNGMILSQRILRFVLKKKSDDFIDKAKKYIAEMPYKQEPYNGRNWGHSWHSLCSYHGKLKPAIAHSLIQYFTKKGDVILDPMCGVGTIPFEACLAGRIGIGNDLSELAYVVTRAKLSKPQEKDVLDRLEFFKTYIEENKNNEATLVEIQKYETFGFNGKIPAYFHEETLKEIITLRRYFISHIKFVSDVDCMIYAAFLHILHGNRPYALSRTSHPLTPYAPKGDFIYKNVIEHIKAKIRLSYKEPDFNNYVKGEAIYGDFADIYISNVDFVITSPPFADSIKFYMQNWMRLWLCGWEQEDFKTADVRFIDQKQKKDFSVYKPFFEMCNRVLKPNGKIILHLGKTQEIDMAKEITPFLSPYFKIAYLGTENVNNIEKHGIRDKGSTVEHEYLFIERI